MKSRVFVSYTHGDLGSVKRLVQDLRVHGVDVWIDYESLMLGEEWKPAIHKAIKNADAVIVCVSRKMLHPGFVNAEIQDALEIARSMPEGKVFVVPVLFDDLPHSNLPWGLGKYQSERLHATGPKRDAQICKLVAALGYPRSTSVASRAEADYRKLCARYLSHVYWWLFGRAIEPNKKAAAPAAERFGDASVQDYMIPITARSVLICDENAAANLLMRKLRDRLYPHGPTVHGTCAPIIVVLKNASDLNSEFLGVVTPTDLMVKWEQWYLRRQTIRDVWFKDPRSVPPDSNVREAYRIMGTILTGIPIVDKRSGRIHGFLPHPGTREDWSRSA